MTGARWLYTSHGTLRAPWQLATFLLAVVAAGAVVGGLGYALLAPTPVERWARVARIPLDQLATLGSLLLATWLAGRALAPTGGVWRLVGLHRAAWRARPLLVATVTGIGVIAVPTIVLAAFGLVRFEPATATDSAGTVAWTALALMAPAALAEELLFRGFVLALLRESAGAAWAVALTSAAFGLAHVTNPDPTLLSTFAVTAAGGFLAVVRLATGSLAAAFVAHFWVNYTQAVVLHAPVSGLALQTPAYRLVEAGPDWLTGGAWGPEGGAAVVAALLVASFVLSRTTDDGRRTNDQMAVTAPEQVGDQARPASREQTNHG